MNNKKSELVLSAIALVKAGEALETAKDTLRKLAEQGIPYESAEMKNALDECLRLQQHWNMLESAHLSLKKRISKS